MLADPETHRAIRAATSGRPRRTPWMALLSAVLTLGQGHAQLLRHTERDWASITFAGTRHTIALAFAGADAVAAGEALIEALPEHEFTIPRQLVADAAIARVDHALLPEPRLEVELEILLLDDA